MALELESIVTFDHACVLVSLYRYRAVEVLYGRLRRVALDKVAHEAAEVSITAMLHNMVFISYMESCVIYTSPA